MKIKIIIILFLIPFIGCKDEFILDSNNYQENLVINGSITNDVGPYTIKVLKTAPVNDLSEIPVKGCTVTIFEKSGTLETYEELTEVEPGVYQTAEGGMQGKIGNSYSLSVITPDGQEYRTDYQKIKEPIEIESVEYEVIVKEHEDYAYGLPGYQFYVSTKQAQTKDNYFLWHLTETYEYTNDYKVSRYILSEEEATNDTIFGYFNYTVFTCWKTQPINYIFTAKTGNLSIPKITKQPLEFVSTTTKRLSQKYSLLVKQLTINEETFSYWNQLREQTSSGNFLLASQLYSIFGNIRNANNDDDLVYGYFTVGSVHKKRIFANKLYKPFYYSKCYILTDNQAIADIIRVNDPPFYFATTDQGIEGLINERCLDCRKEGGTNERPDFWVY